MHYIIIIRIHIKRNVRLNFHLYGGWVYNRQKEVFSGRNKRNATWHATLVGNYSKGKTVRTTTSFNSYKSWGI